MTDRYSRDEPCGDKANARYGKRKNRTKFVYFYGGGTGNAGIFEGWVAEASKRGQNIELTALMPPRKLIRHLLDGAKNASLKVIPHFGFYTGPLFSLLYLLSSLVQSGRIVVHVRKTSVVLLRALRKLFPHRVRYIIDVEGDPVSERDYLLANPYKPGFYSTRIRRLEEWISSIQGQLEQADGVVVVTERLRDLLQERYALNPGKVLVLPTGFDCNRFFFDPALRKRERARLGLESKTVFLFSGNVYYSWQNLSSTLRLFAAFVRSGAFKGPYLLLLVKEGDHEIAREFISKAGLAGDLVHLTSSTHSEVNGYLNAADYGLLLRDRHLMNEVSCPGKVGEYLASGLTVILSDSIGFYSSAVRQAGMGIVLDNFKDFDGSLQACLEYNTQHISRAQRSLWANSHFSVQAHCDKYLNFLDSRLSQHQQ